MSLALRTPMTLPEFLAWEETEEVRWEFDGAQPVAMTEGSYAHEAIGGALRSLLREALRGKPCKVSGPTLKIEVLGRIRYPDAFVHCGPVTRSQTVIDDPLIVFEIVSPTSSRIDRIIKLREYQATQSIQRYIILEQDAIAATVFARVGGVWAAAPLTETDMLDLPEIDVVLPLAALYGDIETAPGDDEDIAG